MELNGESELGLPKSDGSHPTTSVHDLVLPESLIPIGSRGPNLETKRPDPEPDKGPARGLISAAQSELAAGTVLTRYWQSCVIFKVTKRL